MTQSSGSSTNIFYPSLWIDSGIGANNLGIGRQLGLNVEVKNEIFVAYDFDLATPLNIDTDAISHAISIGKLYKTKATVAYSSLGISRVQGTHGEQWNVTNQTYENIGYQAFGLRVEVGIYFTPNILGVGVSVFSNVSSEVQYAGLTLNLAIGQLNGRWKK